MVSASFPCTARSSKPNIHTFKCDRGRMVAHASLATTQASPAHKTGRKRSDAATDSELVEPATAPITRRRTRLSSAGCSTVLTPQPTPCSTHTAPSPEYVHDTLTLGPLPPLDSLPSPQEGIDHYGRPLPSHHIRNILQIGQIVELVLPTPANSPLTVPLKLEKLLSHDIYTVMYRVSDADTRHRGTSRDETSIEPAQFILRVFLNGSEQGLEVPQADCHDYQVAGMCTDEASQLQLIYGPDISDIADPHMPYTLPAPLPKPCLHTRGTVLGRHALLLSDATATLGQLLAGGRAIHPDVVTDITRQLILIMSHAGDHSSLMPTLHCNLTPDCVLLTEVPADVSQTGTSQSLPRYSVVLVGFCPKLVTWAHKKPLHAPWRRPNPDQDAHRSYDKETDIYSLCMLVLHMLAGRDPYEKLRNEITKTALFATANPIYIMNQPPSPPGRIIAAVYRDVGEVLLGSKTSVFGQVSEPYRESLKKWLSHLCQGLSSNYRVIWEGLPSSDPHKKRKGGKRRKS